MKYLVLLTFIISTCRSELQPEKYIIPWGYKGEVKIYLNQDSGTPMESEGDFRIYRINHLGQLRTQWPAQYGRAPYENIRFYYLDSIGNLKLLPSWVIDDKVISSTDSIGIYGYVNGDSSDIKYIRFYIGGKDDYFKHYNKDID